MRKLCLLSIKPCKPTLAVIQNKNQEPENEVTSPLTGKIEAKVVGVFFTDVCCISVLSIKGFADQQKCNRQSQNCTSAN